MLKRLFMACRILRALILISMRLVVVQIWILDQLIGALIARKVSEEILKEF